MKHILVIIILTMVSLSSLKAQTLTVTEMVLNSGLEVGYSQFYRYSSGSPNVNAPQDYYFATAIVRFTSPFVFGVFNSDKPYLQIGDYVLTDNYDVKFGLGLNQFTWIHISGSFEYGWGYRPEEFEGFGGYLGWRGYFSLIGPAHATPLIGLSYNTIHAKVGAGLTELAYSIYDGANTFHTFGLRYQNVSNSMASKPEFSGKLIGLFWDYNF